MMFVTFFVCALGEELGWSGYVIDPLQDRRSALQASVLLGLVWAAWHLVPLIQADRSPEWIGWWSLYTAASRILMTWLYNNTGKSVFAAALYHDMSNLSWQLFPDPRFPLGTTCCGPDHRIRCRNCHSRMGTTNVSSIPKLLTRSATQSLELPDRRAWSSR